MKVIGTVARSESAEDAVGMARFLGPNQDWLRAAKSLNAGACVMSAPSPQEQDGNPGADGHDQPGRPVSFVAC